MELSYWLEWNLECLHYILRIAPVQAAKIIDQGLELRQGYTFQLARGA